MNDRIRQLAKCNERIQNFFETGPVQRAAIEEFAELIVRECLAQVDKVDEMLEDDSEKAGVAWVGYAIEKHFGVEE